MGTPQSKLRSQTDIDTFCSDQFLASIDNAFDAYGGTVKTVVYHALEKEYGLTREDIPKSPETFVAGLEKFFGMGSKPVEQSIIRQMQTCSGLKNLEKYDVITALRKVRHQLYVRANEISER